VDHGELALQALHLVQLQLQALEALLQRGTHRRHIKHLRKDGEEN
jgi:hypothetical protein